MKGDSGYKVLQAGETHSITEVLAGTSIAITPSPGASVTGQYSVSALGNFIPCEFGVITSQLVTMTDASCYELKFTATGGTVTIEWGAER